MPVRNGRVLGKKPGEDLSELNRRNEPYEIRSCSLGWEVRGPAHKVVHGGGPDGGWRAAVIDAGHCAVIFREGVKSVGLGDTGRGRAVNKAFPHKTHDFTAVDGNAPEAFLRSLPPGEYWLDFERREIATGWNRSALGWHRGGEVARG